MKITVVRYILRCADCIVKYIEDAGFDDVKWTLLISGYSSEYGDDPTGFTEYDIS
jgi:hypothetical protein